MLFAAAKGGPLVDALLTHKKKCPFKERELSSYLHLAVKSGSLNVVKSLIKAGANVNLPEETSGATALHMAVDNMYKDIVSYLLTNVSIIQHKIMFGLMSLTFVCYYID